MHGTLIYKREPEGREPDKWPVRYSVAFIFGACALLWTLIIYGAVHWL